ncbi:TolC family protein [Pseudofulvibacter geojedonensis]
MTKNELTYEEFLAYVKKYHPVIKQSNITVTEAESKLLKNRGATDPTLEFNYDDKEFKSSNYWNKFNTTFKVPTILGVDLKVDYQQNRGDFVNPELLVPEDGLYSAGVSIDLARGLLMNERLANIRKGKYFVKQSLENQKLLVNKIIFEASIAYFAWLRYHNEELIYQDYLRSSKIRLESIERSVELGDKPKIDITEARIAYQTVLLDLQKISLSKVKARLQVSNYLWFDSLPLEIFKEVFPVTSDTEDIALALNINNLLSNEISVANHPKIKSVEYKSMALEQDYRLKKNLMLPKLEISYSFLNSNTNHFNAINNNNYKGFISLKQSIFMRKQRAELKLSKLKLTDIELEKSIIKLNIENKIIATQEQLRSYQEQNDLYKDLILDYERMLNAENKRFEIGESSLFLVNSREQKLFNAKIKGNELRIAYLKTILQFFNVLGGTANLTS